MSGGDVDVWRTPPSSPERMGPHPSEDLIWHYTNRSGFEGIVSSGTIWATSTDSLNDTGEGVFGVRDLHDYWMAMRPHLKAEAPADEMDEWIDSAIARLNSLETYVICGCNTGDSLVHWRSYIGDDQSQGFAIGFRPEAEFRALAPTGGFSLYLPDFVPAMFWRDVTYGSHLDWEHRSNYWDRYSQLVEASLTSVDRLRKSDVRDPDGLRQIMDRDLFIAALTSKHEAYRSEDESRVLVFGAPGYAWERQGRYGPQKVITLTGDDKQNWALYSTPTVAPLPIAKVILGPWNAPDDAALVSNLMRDQGYDVPVERSRIPIR